MQIEMRISLLKQFGFDYESFYEESEKQMFKFRDLVFLRSYYNNNVNFSLPKPEELKQESKLVGVQEELKVEPQLIK